MAFLSDILLSDKAGESTAKRVLIIALGNRTTKAVLMDIRDGEPAVTDFFILDNPGGASDFNNLGVKALTDHLAAVRQGIKTRVRDTVIVLNCSDAFLRNTEMPAVPVPVMRKMLEVDSRNYLQENILDHTFDCQPLNYAPDLADEPASHPAEAGAPAADQAAHRKGHRRHPRRTMVLVGGVKRAFLDNLNAAAKKAGLHLRKVIPWQIGQFHALHHAEPAVADTAILAFDLGFTQSSLSIMLGGELVQNRVVNFGGDQVTRGLAQSMNIAYDAAEQVKLLFPEKVLPRLQDLFAPFAQELKASIEFFEAQSERKVSAVYVSGAAAKSSLIMRMLGEAVQLPCRTWQLEQLPRLAITETQEAEFKRELPQFICALGAGIGVLKKMPAINLLAVDQEEELRQQRDPVRAGVRVGMLLCGIPLIWSASLAWKVFASYDTARNLQAELDRLKPRAEEAERYGKAIATHEAQMNALKKRSNNRFLCASLLDALQRSVVEEVVLTQLKTERVRRAATDFALKPKPGAEYVDLAGAPGGYVTLVTLQAKEYSDPSATDRFIDALYDNPYFKQHLVAPNAIRLKSRGIRQADTANLAKSFALVSLECVLKEGSIDP